MAVDRVPVPYCGQPLQLCCHWCPVLVTPVVVVLVVVVIIVVVVVVLFVI